MSENKRATAATSADADEAPELTDEFFDRADLLEGTKVVRRGRGLQKAPRKVVTTLRLDPTSSKRFATLERAGSPVSTLHCGSGSRRTEIEGGERPWTPRDVGPRDRDIIENGRALPIPSGI